MRRWLCLGCLCVLCLLTLTGDAVQEQRVQVTATAYTRTGQRTASGLWPRPGMLAVSRDLERQGFVFGRTVELLGLGTFIVQDRMARRWRARVDLYYPTRRQALVFGKRSALLVCAEC